MLGPMSKTKVGLGPCPYYMLRAGPCISWGLPRRRPSVSYPCKIVHCFNSDLVRTQGEQSEPSEVQGARF